MTLASKRRSLAWRYTCQGMTSNPMTTYRLFEILEPYVVQPLVTVSLPIQGAHQNSEHATLADAKAAFRSRCKPGQQALIWERTGNRPERLVAGGTVSTRGRGRWRTFP